MHKLNARYCKYNDEQAKFPYFKDTTRTKARSTNFLFFATGPFPPPKKVSKKPDYLNRSQMYILVKTVPLIWINDH